MLLKRLSNVANRLSWMLQWIPSRCTASDVTHSSTAAVNALCRTALNNLKTDPYKAKLTGTHCGTLHELHTEHIVIELVFLPVRFS